MGTATILGTEYPTTLMPDGKEWTAKNLEYTGGGIGWWWGGGASNDGDGRYYDLEQAETINDLLTDGWRVPTKIELEAWRDAIFAAHTQALSGGVVKALTGWTAPNVGAVDTYGFSLRGAGYWSAYSGSWVSKGVIGTFGSVGRSDGFWQSPEVLNYDAALGSNSTGGYVGSRYPLRLVRTPPFHGFHGMDFLVAPEWGYEPKITPSLSWTKTASGLWRCLDDGAAFDAYDAEITVKVSGAVHSAWESFIAANRGTQVTYFAPTGVRPFGPHIDCTAGVQVVIGDAWSTDWRVGITADCYTLHIPMRYVGGYTPTLATMPAVVARKYPTPTWFYPTKVHATEAGTATAAPRDTETQTTQVIIDNLDQAGAAAMVNWCLYQRGASFTYTPTAGCFPFGVAAGNGPFTVRLIGWTSQKPKPNRWDMTLDFAREA